MDIATRTGLDVLKTAIKKVALNAAEATGKFIGNEIFNNFVKPKPAFDENWRSVEEIINPPEKREEILSELRQVLKNGTL